MVTSRARSLHADQARPRVPAVTCARASVDCTDVPDNPPDAAIAPQPSTTSNGLDRADIAHLARLARLAVTDEECDTFAGQLEVILGAVARVRELDTDDVAPTSHAVAMTNVFRRDEVRPSLPREAVLTGAPAVEDDKFRVPRILGEES